MLKDRSQRTNKRKNKKISVIKKYLSIKNLLISFFVTLICIPFILIFVYLLERSWYDGMSTLALLYFSFGILIIVFDIAEFKTFSKLKNLFSIKKENNEELTNFEKSQMKVLNLIDSKEDLEEEKKKNNKLTTRFLAIYMIVISIVFLCISLPFVFI